MHTPGEYILLRRIGKVPWPALVCAGNMAPQRILCKKPTGYWTLVLLIKRQPEYVYALESDIIDFEPFGSAQKDDPELEHAYEMVLDEMDGPGSSLDHWRQLTDDSQSEYLPTPSPSLTASSTIEIDSEDDEPIRIAKQMSLAELRTSSMKRAAVTTLAKRPTKRPVPMPAPRFHFSDQRTEISGKGKEKTSLSRPDSSRHKFDRNDYIDGSLYVNTSTTRPTNKKACPLPDPRFHFFDQRHKISGKRKEKANPSRPNSSQNQLNNDDYIDGNLYVKPCSKPPTNRACPLPNPRYHLAEQRTEGDKKGKKKASPSRPDPSHQLNDDDYIDGGLSESKDMVKVYVGEGDQEQEFLIPRCELDKRPSLSDPKIGCIMIAADGTPQLSSPCLRSFPPDDFRFVAEFLSTGTFGRSVLEDDGLSNGLMFAECVATWKIADRLVIEDLLDLIVVKIQQTLPWDLFDAWTLAKIVYETEGSPLKAYTVMKDLVTEAIADNFLDLAVTQGKYFIEPLRELPELQRDVYKKLMERAEAKLAE